MRKTITSSSAIPILLLLACAIPLLFVAACDDDAASPAAGNVIQNALVFTREDGTDLVMGVESVICCGPWDHVAPGVDVQKITFFDPLLATDPENADSFWTLFLVVDELVMGNDYVFPTPAESPFKLFFFDATTGNELSGDMTDSVGTLTVDILDCGPPWRVTLTIDATIGSEYHLAPTVDVSGTFSATIRDNPYTGDCEFGM
ncbi:hypothetical protein H8E07_14320 [bacterium]|nr:hypothetical protein [bacterium]